MTTSDWSASRLPPHATLEEALELLNRTSLQIVLVVNTAGQLVGTLTDGDIRRALLSGSTLSAELSEHMNSQPTTVSATTDPSASLEILRRLGIRALPVVDDEHRVVDLILLEEWLNRGPISTPVLIMAGGRGLRLRPLTDSLPKPLVTVAGETLIDILVRRLSFQGFRQIWVAVHYRATEISEHLGDGSHLGVRVQYLREEEPLGTAGALRLLPSDLAQRPVLVCNSDTLHAADFAAVVDQHVSTGSAATMAVHRHVTEIPFGVVTASEGRLHSVEEKPIRQDLVSSGINVISPDLVTSVAPTGRIDMTQVMEALLQRGLPIAVHELHGYWLDVGNPSSLHQANVDHRPGPP